MEILRSFLAPMLRAIVVVMIGAGVLGGINLLVQKPHTPYYAQLAAKAAKRGVQQKDIGEPYDFTYTGNDTR